MKRFFIKTTPIKAEPLLQEDKQTEEFERKAAEARKDAINQAKLKHLPDAIYKVSQDMEIRTEENAACLHALLKEYFLAGGQNKHLQMPKATLESKQQSLEMRVLTVRSKALREAAAEMAPNNNYKTFSV